MQARAMHSVRLVYFPRTHVLVGTARTIACAQNCCYNLSRFPDNVDSVFMSSSSMGQNPKWTPFLAGLGVRWLRVRYA